MWENIGVVSRAKARFVNDTVGWVVGTPGRMFMSTSVGEPLVRIANNISVVDNFK